MGSRDDDQVERENRQRDAADAREQAERHSEIARGFSHNAEALMAFYGYPRPVSAYPAGYERELRDELRRKKQRLLAQLERWTDPEPASERLGTFMGRVRPEDLLRSLSGVDVTDPDAEMALQRLLRVTSVARWQALPSGLLGDAPAAQRYARNLEWFHESLGYLVRMHEHYRKVVASGD